MQKQSAIVENQIFLKHTPTLSYQISPRTLHFGNAAVI